MKNKYLLRMPYDYWYNLVTILGSGFIKRIPTTATTDNWDYTYTTWSAATYVKFVNILFMIQQGMIKIVLCLYIEIVVISSDDNFYTCQLLR